MDVVTYALCKKQIGAVSQKVDALGEGFDYKGSVASTAALPVDATAGDMYTISGTGDRYVYDGTAWIKLSGSGDVTVSSDDIDAFYT